MDSKIKNIKMSKKVIIEVSTNWCGEDNNFSAIVNEDYENDEVFMGICEELAFENFNDFDGLYAIVEELYPDFEGEYTEEMIQEAANVEEEYYTYKILEDEDYIEYWDDYPLVYDVTNK